MTDLLDKARALETQLRADDVDLADWRPGDHQVIADTLRDLSAEVERLTGLVGDWSTSSILNGDKAKRLEHELSIARADASTARKAWAERDAALARVKELEAEVAAMTPVVESAGAWRDRGDYDDATDACNAVDAYRARKP